MRRQPAFALALFAGLAAAAPALAQDEVYVRGQDKPVKANIKAESPGSVTVAARKDPIPAEDILDVIYEVTPAEVRINLYRIAWQAEKDSNDPSKDAKRKENLDEAVKKYEETLGKLGAGQAFARRHIEYKLALLKARQAQEEGGPLDDAVARLTAFKKKHADGWQIARALRLLARLQLEMDQPAEAEKTYLELASLKVGPQTQNDAELQAALVGLRAGKPKETLEKLNALLAKPPAKEFVPRVRIAVAEATTADGRSKEAVAMLRKLITEHPEPGLKAAAYNALGKSYFDAQQYKEARWEFLWVDVVYNQDREEHAKALYYLWKTFDKLGDAERAKEFRSALVNDRLFAVSEYQRRALSEKGEGKGGKAKDKDAGAS